MAKRNNVIVDENLNKKSSEFINKINSNMSFKSELCSDLMSIDWLDEIAFACPYINNIVRNPRMTLITENDNVKIERARKITVASVKDLSRHTQYIDEVDKETGDVKPSKIMIVRNEETFNTYENRFIFTLIDNVSRFVEKKKKMFEDFEANDTKYLEYVASTTTDDEKIDIELKITSNLIPKADGVDFKKELKTIMEKLKIISEYISSWQKSEFVKVLIKERAPLVFPPIKKTNMILKNPNFQMATKLWNFLQQYAEDEEIDPKEGLNNDGDDLLKGILGDSFLMDYFVLDSISKTKKEEKEKIGKYAVVMIKQQIQRIVSILLNCGIKVTDEEIINIISNGIKDERNKRVISTSDVKKKFKNIMDEYLEKTQDYL
jgi:hypothetical protein